MKSRARFGLFTLVSASLLRRKTRVVLAVVALAIGAGIISAIFSVYGGVRRNLSREFRGYGPNLVITSKNADSGQLLSPADYDKAVRIAGASAHAAGVLYGVAAVRGVERSPRSGQSRSLASGSQLAIMGTELDRVSRLNPSWKIRGPVPQAGEAWIGREAARQLAVGRGDRVSLSSGERRLEVSIAGELESGSAEDNQLFLSLADAQQVLSVSGLTAIQIRIDEGREALQLAAARLSHALPDAEVHVVRQIVETEGRVVLSTTTMLFASVALILVTIGLCVTAALASRAFERQREFGIMRTLGASERAIFVVLAGESLVLGAVAAIVGFASGALVAAAIGHSVFGVLLYPSWSLFWVTIGVTVGMAALASLVPWPLVRRATPATILKGE